jgi:hypothetical protein
MRTVANLNCCEACAQCVLSRRDVLNLKHEELRRELTTTSRSANTTKLNFYETR